MTIKAGDLVMVVRATCCGNGSLGTVFTVDSVVHYDRRNCVVCGKAYGSGPLIEKRGDISSGGYMKEELKRIDPLSDLEDQKDSSGLDERHEFYEALRKMAEGLRS